MFFEGGNACIFHSTEKEKKLSKSASDTHILMCTLKNELCLLYANLIHHCFILELTSLELCTHTLSLSLIIIHVMQEEERGTLHGWQQLKEKYNFSSFISIYEF